ncbi:hypothetical protein K788_0000791 [Paraburkholderia caribensis MBA4]|uniref:Uncharacterized protein n=1 Tax=Paraburkholderia caribensis MBA4 TaxID=1323664 RepID=A0A0P0RHQ9_9BURK|nr:hypothetical protein K788_0000791 [Paraburkholderia caribensis MBA4]
MPCELNCRLLALASLQLGRRLRHSPGDFYFHPTLKISAILPTANDYLF